MQNMAKSHKSCMEQAEIIDTFGTYEHTTCNFAPSEYKGVVNPSGLAVYKGSNTKGKDNSNCNGK